MACVYRTRDALPAALGADELSSLQYGSVAARSSRASPWLCPSSRAAGGGHGLVGRKESGHAYRPDEIAQLEKAAQERGMTLENLRVLSIERELQKARQGEREWQGR